MQQSVRIRCVASCNLYEIFLLVLPYKPSLSAHCGQSWSWVTFSTPNPKFLDPTQPNPQKSSPDPTQPIIDTWYGILGYTENFIQQLLHAGIKVGRNAPERSSGAREFGQERSWAQKSNYLGRNARSTAHKNLISAFRHACFRKSRYITLISGTLSKFLRSRDEQQQHEETCRVFRTAL